MIASRQRDRAATTAARARVRVDDVKDSHRAVSDVEDLDLLLDEPEILMMIQLWRMSRK